MQTEKGSNARRGGLLWPRLYLCGVYKLLMDYHDR